MGQGGNGQMLPDMGNRAGPASGYRFTVEAFPFVRGKSFAEKFPYEKECAHHIQSPLLPFAKDIEHFTMRWNHPISP